MKAKKQTISIIAKYITLNFNMHLQMFRASYVKAFSTTFSLCMPKQCQYANNLLKPCYWRLNTHFNLINQISSLKTLSK
jgi:hypothetical protein